MSDIKQSELWIGGEHVAPSSGEYFDDLNPLDDSLYSRVAEGTAEDMDRAVQVAHEAFKANKHLPEVPSAVEIEANGLLLGEMNMLLLKKIEELTLHTINQQSLIESLLNRIEKLETDEK